MNEYFKYKTELRAYKKWILATASHLFPDKKIIRGAVEDVIKFEIKLAQLGKTSGKSERVTVEELEKKTGLDWSKSLEIFTQKTIYPNVTVIIRNFNYFKKLLTLLAKTNPTTVNNYLIWVTVKDMSRDTTKYMRDLNFLIDQAILGVKMDMNRDYECVDKVIKYLSNLIVPQYVKLYVPTDTFELVESMIEAIKNELVYTVQKSDWLSENGKQLVVGKVENIKFQLGFPYENQENVSRKNNYCIID